MLKVAAGRSKEGEPRRRRANINMRLITPSGWLFSHSVCRSGSGLVSLRVLLVNFKISDLKGRMEIEKKEKHENFMTLQIEAVQEILSKGDVKSRRGDVRGCDRRPRGQPQISGRWWSGGRSHRQTASGVVFIASVYKAKSLERGLKRPRGQAVRF